MNKFLNYLIILVFAAGFVSCEDDIELPDNIIEFESQELGIGADESELIINISFSRETAEAGSVEIGAVLTGLTYGTQFTTEPAMVDNKLILPIASGATGVSFKIIKSDGIALLGDEQIKFTIQSTIESLVLGNKAELTLSFSEILSLSAIMDPNVGGNLQPNKVFVDLSGNRQSFLSRSDWDLGFYTVDGEFRVIHNTSSGMLVRSIDKTDMASVTAADTVGFGAQLSLAAIFSAVMGPPPSWVAESINWFDDSAGDMTKTAIAEISETDSDNKVYIVNRGKNPDGTERGWKKIRIVRNGNGYSLQHADIGSATFQTVNVTRDNAYLFNYVSFESGLVVAEPKKDQWDIAFTVFTNSTPSGPPGAPLIPFEFKDFVIQNRNNVESVQILTATISYEAFAEANLAGLTFSSSQKAIGSSWRSIPSNSSIPPSVNADRFYVIKDPAGNFYKLRFTALTQAGERGRPSIEFALVKKAG